MSFPFVPSNAYPISSPAYQQRNIEFVPLNRNQQPNGKLNQMTTDLAKLKDQLHRMMNQADNFEKKTEPNQMQLNRSANINFNDPNNGSKTVKQKLSADKLPFFRQNEFKNPQSRNINNPQQMNNQFEYSNVSSFNVTPHSQQNMNIGYHKPIIENNTQGLKGSQTKQSKNFVQQNFKINPDVQKIMQENKILQSQKLASNSRPQPIIQSFREKQSIKPVSTQNPQHFSTKSPISGKMNEFQLFLHQNPPIQIQQKPVSKHLQDITRPASQINQQPKLFKFTEETKTSLSSLENEEKIVPRQSQSVKPSSLMHLVDVQAKNLESTSLSKKVSVSSQNKDDYINQIITQQLSKKSISLPKDTQKRSKQQLQFQEKIISLEHQKRALKHQLNNLSLQRDNLQNTIKSQRSQRQSWQHRYHQLENELKQNRRELQTTQDKCKLLQRKLEVEFSTRRSKNITPGGENFDEVLKGQISEISQYKLKIEQKNEQIMRQKDLHTHLRRQIESLNNQIKIEQLKSASQLNEAGMKQSIALQDKDNEIKTLNNLIQTLQSKLSFAIKQNKTKDTFMVQHLTGKAKIGEEKQYIENFFKKYEVEFPENRFGLKLKEEQREIQKLKMTILEIAGKA